MGAAAKRRAAREFDPERTALQYLRLYRSLTRAPRAGERRVVEAGGLR